VANNALTGDALAAAVKNGLIDPAALGRSDGNTPERPKGVRVPQESEAAFQKWVISCAHANGWRVAHFRRVRVQRKNGDVYWETPVAADGKGFPDLALVRERVVWAELKSAGGRPSPEQTVWLAALAAAGQEVYLWSPADRPSIAAALGRPASGLPPR
jgi:hypothetical protein